MSHSEVYLTEVAEEIRKALKTNPSNEEMRTTRPLKIDENGLQKLENFLDEPELQRLRNFQDGDYYVIHITPLIFEKFRPGYAILGLALVYGSYLNLSTTNMIYVGLAGITNYCILMEVQQYRLNQAVSS
ncbi:hypothetical protein GGR52DRAFT_577306 [Hypoxylon sp. FL1284]|nr:hypothetical protein GGR52DRAFT_577306 [Hypoxylon sp. FL1284]